MKLIYISGIDGCGKTTQAQELVKYLRIQGVDAEYKWLRWEPSIGKIIRFIRKRAVNTSKHNHKSERSSKESLAHQDWGGFKKRFLSNRLLRRAWLAYACTDYYLATKKYFRKVMADVLVVDRYVEDFIVDQACNLGAGVVEFRNLVSWSLLNRVPEPNFSIIIHLPSEEGYRRKNDGTPLEYLKEREKWYEQFPRSEDVLHVDGLKSVEAISGEIHDWVTKKLK